MKYVSIGAQKKANFDRNHAVSKRSLSPLPTPYHRHPSSRCVQTYQRPDIFRTKLFASRRLLVISAPHRHPAKAATATVGNRLTVDPRTLTPLVLVRIQVPQPSYHLEITDKFCLQSFAR